MVELSLAELRAEHFEGLIGAEFDASGEDVSETLVLEKIDATRRSPDPARFRDPFSLVFRGKTVGLHLEQQIYPLAHEAIGSLDIFIVPIGRNEDGTTTYQAVFA